MKTLFLSILLLPAYCFAQTPPAAPALPIPSFQPKFSQYGTNQLTSINTSLESKKIKTLSLTINLC